MAHKDYFVFTIFSSTKTGILCLVISISLYFDKHYLLNLLIMRQLTLAPQLPNCLKFL